MSKPDAPAAPDYKGAAEATAMGNRVNQYTPYGDLTYTAPTSGNSTDPWSQHVDLSPVGRQLLDAQNATSLGLSGLQNKGLMGVEHSMNNMPSMDQLPARQINPGQTAQDAIMARQMPILNLQHDRLDNQLANQGIALGSDAYKTAQDQFGRQVNDATSQAALQGIDVGQQARQQGMQEQNYYATQPLNMLNAVRTGSQVQNPTFGPTPGGANYSQAAAQQGQWDTGVYNAGVGAQNSLMGGLMGLGTAGIMKYSDRRLKSNIVRVGVHPNGIGIYEYDIFGERQRGVMADEVEAVMPHAVMTATNGFKMVNYGAL